MAKFRTRARAVDLLGKQQVRDEVTAISELLRNSYDADADEGLIDVDTNKGRILVWDDGDGMSAEDIQNNWLTLGTYSKKSKVVQRTRKGRIKIGEKGIGRLAISTLGDQLLLISKKRTELKEDSTWALMYLHWEFFRNEKVFLEEIEIPVKSFGTLKELLVYLDKDFYELKETLLSNLENLNIWSEANSQRIRREITEFSLTSDAIQRLKINEIKNGGTLFYIKNLEETWNWTLYNTKVEDESLSKRKYRLEQTLHSFQNFIELFDSEIKVDNEDCFTPKISINGLSLEHEESLSPEEVKLYDYALKGTIENGEFYGEAFVGNTDKGEPIYLKREEIAHGLFNKNYGDCGPIKVKWFFIEGYAALSCISKKQHETITDKLRNIGGIFVFRDGLRILPYGEPGNDFLEIEERRTRRAGRYLFSHRRMFGYMEISKERNPHLVDKSSREGFVENKYYSYFKTIAQNLLLWWAINYLQSADKDGRRAIYIKQMKEQTKREESYQKQKKEEEEAERTYFKEVNKKIAMFDKDLKKATESITNMVNNTISENSFFELFSIEDTQKFRDKLFKLRKDLYKNIDEIQKLKVDSNLRYDHSHELMDDINEINYRVDGVREDLKNYVSEELNKILLGFEEHAASVQNKKIKIEDIDSQVDELLKGNYFSFDNSTEKDQLETIEREFGELKNIAIELLQKEYQNRREALNTVKERCKHELLHLKKSLKELKRISFQSLKNMDTELDNVNKKLEGIRETIVNIQNLELDYYDGLRGSEQYKMLRKLILDFGKKLTSENILYSDDEFIGYLKREVSLYRDLSAVGLAAELTSHEFNSLYGSIRKNVSLLKQALKNTRVLPVINNVENSFFSLEQLHQRMSPLYKQTRSVRRSINLKEFIKNTLDYFSTDLTKYEINVFNHIPDNLVVKEATPVLFTPIINLLSNSIYWLLNQEKKEIHFYISNDHKHLYIHDTGPGISQKDRKRIFEPFFTKKNSGRGLGLFLSSDILQAKGHELYLVPIGEETRSLGGACFAIKFKEDILMEE
ncbi:ATP-binding protein [Aneurinibacillus aneurinilyticus]|uniref:histidine kinase n=1 Tax=Aneurinibacillus aneurinilyticus TaxID=1391 RepID=A0A848D138_ANEAE|nr:ATP-binding protein [Aneurinibacillus aneurinilyticus]NMF01149.1 hypothetical protein [Aneurinibacillus aneurinilyticus]